MIFLIVIRNDVISCIPGKKENANQNVSSDTIITLVMDCIFGGLNY